MIDFIVNYLETIFGMDIVSSCCFVVLLEKIMRFLRKIYVFVKGAIKND